MKCLSIQQPWASLIIAGLKRCDLRDWRTSYRGRLAIHASRRFSDRARAGCWSEPLRTWLQELGCNSPTDLPRGVVIGTVDLVDCVSHTDIHNEAALASCPTGRWTWLMNDPQPLQPPIRSGGRLGLFDVPDEKLFPQRLETVVLP